MEVLSPDTDVLPGAQAPDAQPSAPPPSLFHEWFVEYNPIYLFSAALVLAGLTLVSCDVAERGALAGFGVAAIAEVYALALIGGAAFLVRLGARRVGVMVGLLAALYQCDLTMHVETCAFLGVAGALGAVAWLVLFALKLRLLAAALELRLSRSAWLVPVLGAACLALVPLSFRHLAPDARTTLVALALFAVGAAGLWAPRLVESAVGFDYRGRRAVRGVWIMWGAGALLHVAYWTCSLGVDASRLLPAGILLSTRWARDERTVWAIVIGTLLGVVALAPESISSTALMISVVLSLRAYRAPIEQRSKVEPLVPPYRGVGLVPPPPETRIVFARAEPRAMERLLLGVAASLHLSLWTMAWSGGSWPAHQPLLDLVLVAVCAFALWKGRRAIALAPVTLVGLHLAIQSGWLGAPRDSTQLGVWSIALGFALLGGALATSWRAHRVREPT